MHSPGEIRRGIDPTPVPNVCDYAVSSASAISFARTRSALFVNDEVPAQLTVSSV